MLSQHVYIWDISAIHLISPYGKFVQGKGFEHMWIDASRQRALEPATTQATLKSPEAALWLTRTQFLHQSCIKHFCKNGFLNPFMLICLPPWMNMELNGYRNILSFLIQHLSFTAHLYYATLWLSAKESDPSILALKSSSEEHIKTTGSLTDSLEKPINLHWHEL